MKKALITFAISLNLIFASVLMPFSLYANGSLPSPFVGFNVNILEIESDLEYETSINSTSGTYSGTVARHTASASLSGNIVAIERTSAGVTYVSTSISEGSVHGTDTMSGSITENAASESGTITLNLSSSSSSYVWQNQLLEVEMILDNDYVGYFNMTFKRGNTNLSTKTIYVNGSSAKFTFWLEDDAYTTPGLEAFSIAINSFNLSSSLYKDWNYPVESFVNILTLFNAGFQQVGINGYNDYLFPIFQEDSTKIISNTSVTVYQKKCILVMYTNRSVYNAITFNNFFTYNSNFTISDFKYVQRSTAGWIIHVTFENTSSSSQTLNLKSINSTGKFTVIYNNIYYDSYPVSTDFALQFGLNNDVLSTLNIIANGTSGSNSTVSNFNQTEQTMNNTIDDYNEIENSFTDDFEENITAINPSDHGLSLMGSKFLNSANWVKTQFDRITTGTPFGSVLGFSLVLGLGLLIIGRVFG